MDDEGMIFFGFGDRLDGSLRKDIAASAETLDRIPFPRDRQHFVGELEKRLVRGEGHIDDETGEPHIRVVS